MRNIVLIGVGAFGFHCARALEGRAIVTAIDTDEATIQHVGPYVSRAVVADGTRKEVLEELGVPSVDVAVVSLGDRMEASLLATLHLKSLKLPHIVVKCISEEHGRILKILGANRIVYPEREMAENLAVSILERGVIDYLHLYEEYGIIEVLAPQQFWGMSLAELDLRRRYRITLIAIFGKGDRRLISPHPDDKIESEDKLVMLGEETQILEFEKALNKSSQSKKQARLRRFKGSPLNKQPDHELVRTKRLCANEAFRLKRSQFAWTNLA